MAGMWELPHSPDFPSPAASADVWRTFRHSITVTDYNVHVLKNWLPKGKSTHGATIVKRGKWVAIADLPALPITGLTRKILKADGVI